MSRSTDSNPVLRGTVLGTRRRALRASAGPAAARAASVPAHDQAPADDEARALGYAEGKRQGMADAAARIAEEVDTRQRQLAKQFEQAEGQRAADHDRRVAALDNVMRSLSQAADEQRRAIETDAIALAFEALCRVLGPDTGREALLARLVQQGLTQLRSQRLLTLRTHPQDLAELRASPEGLALVERGTAVQWLPDPMLERGACVLETDSGMLDVGLQSQLERLRQLWTMPEVAE